MCTAKDPGFTMLNCGGSEDQKGEWFDDIYMHSFHTIVGEGTRLGRIGFFLLILRQYMYMFFKVQEQ